MATIAGQALNAICPYFTMFPLDFPYTVLRDAPSKNAWVLDPFCGRGTTNYASRLLGMSSIGIDSSPVAAALTAAKLANTTPMAILRAVDEILGEVSSPLDMPTAEFWQWAYDTATLQLLCRLREGLLARCDTDARVALRAILMGALHGPLAKSAPSYFSNQSPRTYAPKPAYAVRFWQARHLRPSPVDVRSVIARRAERYYGQEVSQACGKAVLGDSRDAELIKAHAPQEAIAWIITSPPYYGLNTYIPDQWLRHWFVGGPSSVDYASRDQLMHTSPAVFAAQLRQVWQNVAIVAAGHARLVVRFGGINERRVDPLDIIQTSLRDSGWRITETRPAGSASQGRRQAEHFSQSQRSAVEEHDVFAALV